MSYPTPFMPIRLLYALTIAIIFIIFLPFIIILFQIAITGVSNAISSQMTANSGVGEPYTAWGYANTFIVNIWYYMLAIALMGLAYWVWTYTQRKGVEMP